MKSIYQFSLIIACFGLIAILPACNKAVEVNGPASSINGDNVYKTDATAIAVLTGLYANLTNKTFSQGSSLSHLSLYAGLSADEFTLYSGVAGNYLAFYTNLLTNTTGANFWQTTYPYIYVTNAAIEGLNASTTLTPAVKQQLLGEAKFMRAFYYFYLTNLYGDVPLQLSTDYKATSLLPRAPQASVYQQIVTDLTEAQTLLSDNWLDGTLLTASTDRVRPSKWAATALLARTYLYMGQWAQAETQATTVIGNSNFSLSTLNNAFLKASSTNKEPIWQLQPTFTGHNTEDAWIFVLPATGPANSAYPVYLNANLLSSFELGDQRAISGNWVQRVTVGTNTYAYPFKYKSATLNAPVTEYETVFRLGEIYLIRAEARAQQNNTSGAASDLNAIRNRAGLLNTTASTQATLLTAIQQERRVELFSEWGHRWLDLKRTGNVDAVMGAATTQKGGTWNTNQKLYPINLNDLSADPNLVQNPGY